MKRIHILLLILFVVAGIFLVQRLAERNESSSIPLPQKRNWLVEKYGPKKYSQHDEELIIRDFFQDQRDGFFVDIGASHYRVNSTTYYLERHLGWKGIAVDPISEYGKGYLVNRKNTHFYALYVGDRSDEETNFYIIKKNKRLSSSSIEVVKKEGQFEKVRVLTITLNDLLEREGVSHIDFLSMDIELAEPAALAGFDIKIYQPDLVCIEAHQLVLDQILEYFEKNDYTIIEKYRDLDPLNLYFTPKEGSRKLADESPPSYL
jgi:FkbM family methyltransferase